MRRVLAIFLVSLGLGCDANPAPGEADAAGPVVQGAPARAELVVNEVAPRPSSGADWIELFNRSGSAVDLCDYFVSDSLDRLDHYHHLAGTAPPQECVPTLLGPGEYLVVFADDEQGAPFRLGPSDEVHVISREGEALDSLIYFHDREEDLSLSRVPNGEGLFHYSGATQAAENGVPQ